MKLNGEFFAKHCAPAAFCLAKKFGQIDPYLLEAGEVEAESGLKTLFVVDLKKYIKSFNTMIEI